MLRLKIDSGGWVDFAKFAKCTHITRHTKHTKYKVSLEALEEILLRANPDSAGLPPF